MSFASRLKEKREERGLTQVQLANLLGLSNGAVGNYEAGISSPRAEILYKVFDVLDCDANYLFQDEFAYQETSQFSQEEYQHIKKYRVLDVHGKRVVDGVLDLEYDRMTHVVEKEQKGWITYINCYDLAVSAGPGEPWEDDNGYKTRLEIPTERVPENAHYCARVNGDSMEPAYKDGDIVFVQRQDEMVREGEIGIFALNGEGYIKRLGDHQLISLNPAYDPILIHEYDELRCQGRVLGRLEK